MEGKSQNRKAFQKIKMINQKENQSGQDLLLKKILYKIKVVPHIKVVEELFKSVFFLNKF